MTGNILAVVDLLPVLQQLPPEYAAAIADRVAEVRGAMTEAMREKEEEARQQLLAGRHSANEPEQVGYVRKLPSCAPLEAIAGTLKII